MPVSRILIGFIIFIYILYVGLELFGHYALAYVVSTTIIPLISLLYFISIKTKKLFFSLFLVCYSITELQAFTKDLFNISFNYYTTTVLCILAYLFLFVHIYKSLDFNKVLKKFKIQIIILGVLSFYMGYMLFKITSPSAILSINYFLEIAFNTIILLTLSLAFLNYLLKENKKSGLLFLGTLCIIFSEVINVAITFITNQIIFNIIFITLLVAAFILFYLQSKLNDKVEKQIIMD